MSGNEREIQRSIEANKTGRKCETCGNDIRKSDDKATERQCGFCASVYPANAHALAEERSDDSQQRVVGRRIIQTAAGPMCSVCGRGDGVWLAHDESPCRCTANKALMDSDSKA